MFYEVRVLDNKGELKKVISPKRLSKQFWKRHNQPQEFSGKQVYEDNEFELESEWEPDVSRKKPNLFDDLLE